MQFNRDIRPILSSKCFFCHGPSEKSREANLRLDLEEEAFKEKKGIAAFVRNSLDDSEAWHRVTSDDPDEVMPPPEFKKELNEYEIKTIKAWIEQGAKWEGHWAFMPLSKQKEPKTDLPHWVRNPIDSFVLKTLKNMTFILPRKPIVGPYSEEFIWISRDYPPLLLKFRTFYSIFHRMLTKKWSIIYLHLMLTLNA